MIVVAKECVRVTSFIFVTSITPVVINVLMTFFTTVVITCSPLLMRETSMCPAVAKYEQMNRVDEDEEHMNS